jgi:hypothetical protein
MNLNIPGVPRLVGVAMENKKQPHAIAICGAKTRNGSLCKSPPVTGKRRCRMHGGSAGSGAPIGNKNAFKHGHYRAKAIRERKKEKETISNLLKTLKNAEDFMKNNGLI